MTYEDNLVNSGLLRVGDAAKFLSVSRAMVYKLMETGQLRYVKIGRCRRLPKQSITDLAKENLIGGWKLPPMGK